MEFFSISLKITLQLTNNAIGTRECRIGSYQALSVMSSKKLVGCSSNPFPILVLTKKVSRIGMEKYSFYMHAGKKNAFML